jgi:hypothetical protein
MKELLGAKIGPVLHWTKSVLGFCSENMSQTFITVIRVPAHKTLHQLVQNMD